MTARPGGSLPEHARLICDALVRVESVRDLGQAQWDVLVRVARRARLLGTLAWRIRDQANLWRSIPEPVRGHLTASIHFTAWRNQALKVLIAELRQTLPASTEIVLLKGGGYLAQGLPFARGRMPGDLDVLLPREALDPASEILRANGWSSGKLSAYDLRYYREWSHELPPLRNERHVFELDLHHAIAPVTSRVRPETALLLERSRALETGVQGGCGLRVLHPLDQIVHSAVHLFQDTELDERLRDLVDLDGLIRYHVTSDAGWGALRERARQLGAGALLETACRYCTLWLETPIPESMRHGLRSPWQVAALDWIVTRTLLPALPQDSGRLDLRVAHTLARVRYHRMRMPPPLLIRHVFGKGGGLLRAAVERLLRR